MRLLRLPVASGLTSAIATGLLLATVQPSAVRAHAIESSLERLSSLNGASFATASNDGLQLESRFSTGEPAQSATVRLVSPQGEAIVLGQTNAEGKLQFELPLHTATDWELQVDAGPGHRDYLELNPTLMGPLARKLAQPQRSLAQRSHLLVGLTGMGLGAAGLLGLNRRRRRRH